MIVRFKKLCESAVCPMKAHATDAGFDLVATSKSEDSANKVITYGTGLAMEIPEGYVGLIFPRSSIYKTGMALTNCVGVIDSGYRGEIMAKFKLTDLQQEAITQNVRYDRRFNYQVGDRIAQIIILPYPDVTFLWANNLTESDRGAGGYGSTGK